MNRIIRVLAALMLLVIMSTACLAEGSVPQMTFGTPAAPAAALKIQKAWYDQTTMMTKAQFYCPVEYVDQNNTTVMVDNAPVQAGSVNISPYNLSGMGTTWIFALDTSAFGRKDGDEPCNATMEALFNLPNYSFDNAMFVYPGCGQNAFMLVNNASTLDDLYDSTPRTDDSVNLLMDAIWQGLSALQNAQSQLVRGRVNLVIVSDGENKNSSYANMGTLQGMVKDGRTTVYTVTFTDDDFAANNAGYGVLATSSTGGIEIQNSEKLGKKEVKAKIIDVIAKNENCFRLLSIMGVQGSNLTINVQYGAQVLSDSAAISGGPSPVITPEPTEPPVPTPIPDDPVIIFGLTVMEVLFIGGGILVLAALIVILAVVLSRRGGRGGDRNRPISVEVGTGNAGGPPDEPEDMGGGDAPSTIPDPIMSAPVQVTFTPVDGSHAPVVAAMRNGELVVGRNAQLADVKLAENDPKASNRHMILRYQRGHMMIEDCSRNGTRVNNVPITAPTPLHQQAVVTLGVTSYRVTWWIR